jgi:hypothetical protein
MMSAKWYSPQLSREIVRRLYRRAKIEHVPMTVLANRLIERALGPNESGDIQIARENNAARDAE